MLGTIVNPAVVRPGDSIATKYRHDFDEDDNEIIIVSHTRPVKKANFCPTQPEFFHLDHECYDTRISTVVLAQK
jgi:hypothetical protein